eukprot:1159069-Pelagomonas_calceolata.AAC.6
MKNLTGRKDPKHQLAVFKHGDITIKHLHTSGRQRDDGTVRVAFSRAVHAHGFLPVTPAPCVKGHGT